MMRVILIPVLCSSISASIWGRLQGKVLGKMAAHHDERWRKEIMMSVEEQRGQLVHDLEERMRGHRYVTRPNNTINGRSLMAELTFFNSTDKARLTFWGSKVTGASPHAIFIFSLEISPSLYQVVHSEISLPFGESIEIKATPDNEKRPGVIIRFNKKFGDFFKARKSDFRMVSFTPSRNGKENDSIDLLIGDQPIRLFCDC